MIFVIFYLIIATVFAFVCANMAKNRSRSAGLWGFLGFLIGLIAVIVLAIIGNDDSTAQQAEATPATGPLDEIAKLKELLDEGALNQEEFDAQKQKLLS